MTDFSPPAIIARFGGNKALAERLGIPPSTVANWPARNRIPGKYWPKIIGLLQEPDVGRPEQATSRG